MSSYRAMAPTSDEINALQSNEASARKRKKSKGGKDGKGKKFCTNCWREDYHVPVNRNPFLVVFYTILTMGTYFLFRKIRCKCCGKKRSYFE